MESAARLAQDQVIGAAIEAINRARVEDAQARLLTIMENEKLALSQQDKSLLEAFEQVQNVRDFLGKPENILGSDLTKHGEIAENIEVNIRNARGLLEGKIPTATFDNVGRTAPEDYLIDGLKVQSKFINGTNNNLDHVIKHMNTYSDFGRDGSFYHIPKDTYSLIDQIMKGNPPEELSTRTVNKIIVKVHLIEKETGVPYFDVVKPSLSNYSDVQQGKVLETLEQHEKDLKNRNIDKKEEIRDESKDKRKEALADKEPSLQEGLKAAGVGALLGGGFKVGIYVYQQMKEGKNLKDFNQNDWRKLGVEFGKGSTKGGITGSSIYALTNLTDISAPMASAMVSASFGVSKLAMELKKGNIDMSEFIVQGQVTCLETGMVALGATIGTTIIPIPILGTLIGSFATSTLIDLTKRYLTDQEEIVTSKLNEIYNQALHEIEEEYRKIVEGILEEYEKLGRITKMAFDFETNAMARFQQSQHLS